MIPALTPLPGAPWDVLPAGLHRATLSEVEAVFAYNRRRRELFGGLVRGALALRLAGSPALYPDGSFVTAKPIPGDYDACWETRGVTASKLDPVFLDFSNLRQAHKAKYGGEFFPKDAPNRPGETIFQLFQKEKATQLPKGIIVIALATDPLLTALAP
ncbi:MAG: hypothetical protein ABL956_02750 [Hyphomonadaceae bacterium]